MEGSVLDASKQTSQSRSWLGRACEKCEALMWMLAATFVAFYGTGRDDLFTVVFTDTRIQSTWMLLGYAAVGLNVGLFFYLYFWLQWLHGVKHPEDQFPSAVIVGSTTLAVAGVAFTIGMWPVWSFLSPVILFILFMGFIMSLHFLPNIGFLKAEGIVSHTNVKND